LVESWGISGAFSTPIRFHHAPSELDDDDEEILTITRILHMASLFIDVLFRPKRTMSLGILDSYAKEYGFSEKLNFEEMAESVQEQAEEVLPMFEIQIVKEENYMQMIDEARTELISLSSNFLSDLMEQKKKIEELNQKVVHDSMTGLKNYHYFIGSLEKEINRSLRYDMPLSLIFSDIDHFKKVNDTYGHLAGDHVLRSMADCLKSGLRDSDTVARYGGEEFGVILPETDLAGARIVAERMRKQVEQQQLEFEGKKIQVTMSFGIASFSFDEDATKNGFIQKADQALYKAKETGRNKCCWH
jgi:diguanylate cyclase (GGDEF)-like protein